MARTLSEPEKKTVAARQGWQCSVCQALLSAAYQVDHTVALCDGGADSTSNATAMCANCHALKTQHEAAGRAADKRRAAAAAAADRTKTYADRTDWYRTPTLVQCDLCRRTRPAHTPHTVCVGIEDPTGIREAVLLQRFAYSAGRSASTSSSRTMGGRVNSVTMRPPSGAAIGCTSPPAGYSSAWPASHIGKVA